MVNDVSELFVVFYVNIDKDFFAFKEMKLKKFELNNFSLQVRPEK